METERFTIYYKLIIQTKGVLNTFCFDWELTIQYLNRDIDILYLLHICQRVCERKGNAHLKEKPY